jgi:hypothetical protein
MAGHIAQPIQKPQSKLALKIGKPKLHQSFRIASLGQAYGR